MRWSILVLACILILPVISAEQVMSATTASPYSAS